jgi:hypothetical protein
VRHQRLRLAVLAARRGQLCEPQLGLERRVRVLADAGGENLHGTAQFGLRVRGVALIAQDERARACDSALARMIGGEERCELRRRLRGIAQRFVETSRTAHPLGHVHEAPAALDVEVDRFGAAFDAAVQIRPSRDGEGNVRFVRIRP